MMSRGLVGECGLEFESMALWSICRRICRDMFWYDFKIDGSDNIQLILCHRLLTSLTKSLLRNLP
jgi:hypothetical protein